MQAKRLMAASVQDEARMEMACESELSGTLGGCMAQHERRISMRCRDDLNAQPRRRIPIAIPTETMRTSLNQPILPNNGGPK